MVNNLNIVKAKITQTLGVCLVLGYSHRCSKVVNVSTSGEEGLPTKSQVEKESKIFANTSVRCGGRSEEL